MPLRFLVRSFPALFLLAVSSGCSLTDDTVARVGRRAIGAEDLLVVARQIGDRYPGPPDSAKASLLEDLVRRELLVQAAHDIGLHRDTVFLDLRRRTEDELLRQRLLVALGGTGVPVSEAELRTLHAWRGQETRARVIFTPSREAATGAFELVRGGMDFAAVADRFNPAGFTPPGGDLDFVPPGYLLPPLDDLVREGDPGRIYGPIEAPGQGWFVLRVEQRRARQIAPLEEERPLLQDVLRQRKQRAGLQRNLERLAVAHEVRVLPGAAEQLIRRMLPTDGSLATPILDEAESALPLGLHRGGSFTLGDAYRDIEERAGSRPNFMMSPAVEQWIRTRTLDRVLGIEGRARRYLEEPDMARALRERAGDALLQGYYNQQIVLASQPSEADARLFYERGGRAFSQLREARVLWVALRDSAAASQLAATAGQAENLRDAVATAGLGVRVRNETLTVPLSDPFWPMLADHLRDLPEGRILGPVPAPDGWRVIQLQSKRVEMARFDSLPESMRDALRHEAGELMQAARVETVLDSLRRAIPVTIHARRLKRLRWPEAVPAPMPAGG